MDGISLPKSQYTNNSELEVLRNVLQNLFELGFISRMEYRKAICTNITDRRESIYRMMITKDLKTASKIFSTVRSYMSNIAVEFDDVSNDDFDDGEVVANNPLKIEAVIKTVFGFLNVADLKNCALVCEKWNCVAEPIFRKRCKIMFTIYKNPSLSPNTFLDTFKYSLPNLPFTAFLFHDYFPFSELTRFFTSYGKNITELEINISSEEDGDHVLDLIDIQQQNTYDNESIMFDISPWISESNLKRFNLIDRYYGRFIVSWNKLHSLQDLQIEKAAMSLDAVKITPKRIHLMDVIFFTGGKKSNTLNIDEIVNFTKACDIALVSEDYKSTILEIDLSISKVIAQSVYFKAINVLNWRLSTWEVQKLTLIDTPLLEKCGLTVKELCFSEASIDLSALPDTIEKLTLKVCHITFTQPTIFPNLQILKFVCNEVTDYTVLPQFSTCENLTELILTGSSDLLANIQINVDLIPRSVKNVKLKGSCIEIVGDTILNLQLLLLQNCEMGAVRQWISKLKYEVLIIQHKPYGFPFNQVDNQLVPFINQLNQAEPIYVNVCEWDYLDTIDSYYCELDDPKTPFEKSIFKNMVDKKCNNYVFTHKYGLSITEEEFNKINTFYKKPNNKLGSRIID